MTTPKTPWTVAVIGAYGHTGRFVVAELLRRGMTPIMSGRDATRLDALRQAFPGVATRPATVDDPASLDRALAGVDAVVNCAGPFAATAAPLIEAALRNRVHYLDVTAETEVVLDVAGYDGAARAAGIAVAPAVAFYGGLGDLLATAALDGRTRAGRISIAYALSNWWPTGGTRATGQVSASRRAGRRIRYAEHRLQAVDGPAPVGDWTFPDPVGTRRVVGEFTMADSATIPAHLDVDTIDTFMTIEAAGEVRSPDTPTPVAADESGRSAQTFLVEVVVAADGRTGRASAAGRDIYAVSAPLVVEAVQRILGGEHRRAGVLTAGALGDARDYLMALHPDHLTVTIEDVTPRLG